MMARSKKQGENFGLMLIDVDYFKRINDTFGHAAGDQILVNIGQALNHCVRPTDFVARLGGDEFAILLAGLTGEDADHVGERIRKSIEMFNFNVGDGSDAQTSVTMSMGLVVVYADDTVDSLFDRADKALYRSKEMGRNRLSIISGPPVVAIETDNFFQFDTAPQV
jgi:diguanylate cyclase